MEKKRKVNRFIGLFNYDECPKCGYALIVNTQLRSIGIRECARCDFVGRLQKKNFTNK
jgi:hypothetical protein